jgi:uncharacterized membrane protein YhiD involved in acid resistance
MESVHVDHTVVSMNRRKSWEASLRTTLLIGATSFVAMILGVVLSGHPVTGDVIGIALSATALIVALFRWRWGDE